MRGVSRMLTLLVDVGSWSEVMRKGVAQMRRLVKVILGECKEAHVTSGVDAGSVVQQ